MIGKIKEVDHQKEFEFCTKYEFYLFTNKNLGDEPLMEVHHQKNQAFSNVWIISFGDKPHQKVHHKKIKKLKSK